jgi:DNA polymerase-3 subunit gamma/tau
MAKDKSARAASLTPPSPESYTVVARRYRPQQFEDLVGQEPVARALINALESNRVAHAYLFTGARGVGKTSTARILAKALNCVKGPTAHPCDKCDSCLSITSGEDVDVLEIDGASNRGIDNVRELRSNTQYRPTRARYRIYIIDEVHMLSREAFNALLKTLEEPPPHVKFIFATTEVQKIPITILSRCQRFDFAGIGHAAIVERLKQIVKQEGMTADDEALEMIARRAGGSMRDAQSLLDQLLAFSGEKLTAEQVHGLLGTAQEERVLALAHAVLAGDMPRALSEAGHASDQGVQLGELLDQLIAYWRDLMMVSAVGKDAPDVSIGPKNRATLLKHAETLSMDGILAGLDVLAAARARMRQSSHARTLFEMALVRLARLNDLVSVAELAQLMGQGGQVTPRTATPSSRASTPALADGRPGTRPNEDIGTLKKKSDAALNGDGEAGTNGADRSEQLELTPDTLPQIVDSALAGLGTMFAHHVRLATAAISGPNALVFCFSEEYTQEKDYCSEPERFRRLEESFRKVLQFPCRVRIETAAGPAPSGNQPDLPAAQGKPADNSLTGGDGQTVKAVHPPPERSAIDRRRHREEVRKIPLVKAALELLDAQIVKLDDEFGHVPEGTVRSAARSDDSDPAQAVEDDQES